MGQDKNTVADSGAVANQQALVNLLLGKTATRPVKHVIPGGKHMFTDGHEMNLKQLEIAVFTWLRRVRSFEECSIRFTNEPTKYPTTQTRTIDFPTDQNAPVWDLPSKGKSYLAKIMAEQIAKGNLTAVTAKKDGLYVTSDPKGDLSPANTDWDPCVEFIRGRKSEYSVY